MEFARDNFRNYDFEGRLNVRIQAALRYYSEDASVINRFNEDVNARYCLKKVAGGPDHHDQLVFRFNVGGGQ